MEDPTGAMMAATSARVMSQLAPQLAALTNAIPALMAMGPNTEQLVTMGKAMFQGAMQIPAASSAQAGYIQGIQELADAMSQAAKAPPA